METKVCSWCAEEKSLDDFGRDKWTLDKLKTVCKACLKVYIPKKPKIKIDAQSKKVCISCNRTLFARSFGYNSQTEDRLLPICRSCTAQHLIDVDEAEEWLRVVYEEALYDIISTKDVKPADALKKHRGEFEQLVSNYLTRLGMCETITLPAWVHSSSLADYEPKDRKGRGPGENKPTREDIS